MPEASDALQIMLFNYGYDVWWDGNRGTMYQRGSDEDEVDDYWNFDFMTMATQDQTAQIEYVLSKSDYEKLSYIGYSMGTMQMYSLLGLGVEDAAIQATLDKVDKFLSMASCPVWSNAIDTTDIMTGVPDKSLTLE